MNNRKKELINFLKDSCFYLHDVPGNESLILKDLCLASIDYLNNSNKNEKDLCEKLLKDSSQDKRRIIEIKNSFFESFYRIEQFETTSKIRVELANYIKNAIDNNSEFYWYDLVKNYYSYKRVASFYND